MEKVQIDISKAYTFVAEKDYALTFNKTLRGFKLIFDKMGKGKEFLGWLDLPFQKEANLEQMQIILNHFVKNINLNTVVVIGIGGSYLGGKAVISALSEQFLQKETVPEILFAGHHLDTDYYNDLMEYLNNRNFGLVVISKSGATFETSVVFRILRKFMEKKYGRIKANKRTIAITDARKGYLKEIADMMEYPTFVIPPDVGGRFSVLSPVGLVPIALAGFSITELLRGAKDISNNTRTTTNNPVLDYVTTRNALYNFGKSVELFATFNTRLKYFAEWWKQLFGESEGKEGKGIFPASAQFTTDLHSLGQFIQEGSPILFETIIKVSKAKHTIKVTEDKDNFDYLNYLSGKTLHDINMQAIESVVEAHFKGGIPIIQITIPEINEYFLGQLIYFFELSAATSAYAMNLNPFDQPGVEKYKINLFKRLGK
ncbi:MAG TPA: glucose-6-phosphate isomerase [Bacteroidales bacterium]|nr:glucose-6-phosphate isomerase [Bacteroidales bacterium]